MASRYFCHCHFRRAFSCTIRSFTGAQHTVSLRIDTTPAEFGLRNYYLFRGEQQISPQQCSRFIFALLEARHFINRRKLLNFSSPELPVLMFSLATHTAGPLLTLLTSRFTDEFIARH